MIRCGNQIRLHPKDTARIAQITGEIPRVSSAEALNNFIDTHSAELGTSGTPEARLLALLLQDEKVTPESR
jgi:hypothetical protein